MSADDKKSAEAEVRSYTDSLPQDKSSTNTSVSGNPDNREGIARKIWLAGLGAYGETLSNAVSLAEHAGSEGQKLFNELVSRGEQIQDATESHIENTRLTIEQRIEMARKQLTAFSSPAELSKKVGELTAKMDKLSADINNRDD